MDARTRILTGRLHLLPPGSLKEMCAWCDRVKVIVDVLCDVFLRPSGAIPFDEWSDVDGSGSRWTVVDGGGWRWMAERCVCAGAPDEPPLPPLNDDARRKEVMVLFIFDAFAPH